MNYSKLSKLLLVFKNDITQNLNAFIYPSENCATFSNYTLCELIGDKN